MKVYFHRHFEKQYRKLKLMEKKKLKERLSLFRADEFSPRLNNHPLRGLYRGYRSINITGDLRAIYKSKDKDTRVFVAVDTHSNLYR